MKFRPCIDIHNGKVKQIVGGSLTDRMDYAQENFVSEMSAADYARMYQKDGLSGGHIIMLNGANSPYYEATKQQAINGLLAAPGTLQVGGGVNDTNAQEFLDAGASHVIVTSFVFSDGLLKEDNLAKVVQAVGKEHLVLDLSCRKKDGAYYVVTNRWQCFTDERVTPELMERLSNSCDEFLIHAVDVEGMQNGIEEELLAMLGGVENVTMTYAGGIRSTEDINKLAILGNNRIDFTIGSALDLFGGKLPYADIAKEYRGNKE